MIPQQKSCNLNLFIFPLTTLLNSCPSLIEGVSWLNISCLDFLDGLTEEQRGTLPSVPGRAGNLTHHIFPREGTWMPQPCYLQCASNQQSHCHHFSPLGSSSRKSSRLKSNWHSSLPPFSLLLAFSNFQLLSNWYCGQTSPEVPCCCDSE